MAKLILVRRGSILAGGVIAEVRSGGDCASFSLERPKCPKIAWRRLGGHTLTVMRRTPPPYDYSPQQRTLMMGSGDEDNTLLWSFAGAAMVEQTKLHTALCRRVNFNKPKMGTEERSLQTPLFPLVSFSSTASPGGAHIF